MIQLTNDTVSAELNALLFRLSDFSPILTKIGEEQRDIVRGAIMGGKEDPEGQPWAPWTPRTLRERTLKGNAGQGLLWDTSQLLDSINIAVSSHEVAIGSDAEYAFDLQFGNPDANLPARPFLGWAEIDFQLIPMQIMGYIDASRFVA